MQCKSSLRGLRKSPSDPSQMNATTILFPSCDGILRPAVYQHTPALPPAPYHKPKYEPVVYEEEYPKQNCSVVDETIKVILTSSITSHI